MPIKPIMNYDPTYFYVPYKKPLTPFPWVTALFALFLGPLGILISRFIRLAVYVFCVYIFIISFNLFIFYTPYLPFLLLLAQLILVPFSAWWAHKSYEEGRVTSAGVIGASRSKSGTLDAALSGYRQQFIDIGYGVKAATTGNYDAILSTSLKPNAALDERKVLGAAFGVTDGRYYATYFYTESMADKAVQVSGVYVGAQEAELSPPRLRELLPDPLPIEDSIWISEGWLLTETQAETVTIDTAMRQWSLLNEVLDAEEDILGLQENIDCAPIDAARKLFPEF